MPDVNQRPSTTAERAVGEPAVLKTYRQRTRRANTIYAGVLAIIVIVTFVAVKLAYAHGELNKVSFRTAPAAAPMPAGTPGSTLRLAWHTADNAAGGTPFQDGVVVTWAGHTVNGRDARTGEVRWHYTRADETICSVVQQDSSTIAIYRRKGNCDEVTGFVTATGEPKFYRTLYDNGNTQSASLSNVVMTVGSNFVHEFDNAGGLDRWNWTAPAGCTVTRALAGTLGTLIALDCGSTHQLVLRDLIQDITRFSVETPTALVPIAAAAFVGALDPVTGTLYRYSQDKGVAKAVTRLPGAPATGYPRAAAALSTTDSAQQPVEFALAGKLVAFFGDGSVRWTAAATSAPNLIADAFVAVADGAAQVRLHRVTGGQVQLTTTISPALQSPGSQSHLFAVGSGLGFTGGGGSGSDSGVSVYA
ncbi:MAG TPA: hypothetical protein VHO01_11930 [Jatrophihabitans sp.]|nr:hypothetical protein [Jatrophihabitans sp.]